MINVQGMFSWNVHVLFMSELRSLTACGKKLFPSLLVRHRRCRAALTWWASSQNCRPRAICDRDWPLESNVFSGKIWAGWLVAVDWGGRISRVMHSYVSLLVVGEVYTLSSSLYCLRKNVVTLSWGRSACISTVTMLKIKAKQHWKCS